MRKNYSYSEIVNYLNENLGVGNIPDACYGMQEGFPIVERKGEDDWEGLGWSDYEHFRIDGVTYCITIDYYYDGCVDRSISIETCEDVLLIIRLRNNVILKYMVKDGAFNHVNAYYSKTMLHEGLQESLRMKHDPLEKKTKI